MRLAILFLTTVLTAALCFCAACSRGTDNPLSAVANLDAELARHLLADDDSSFARYARRAGTVVLRDGNSVLLAYRRQGPEADFAARDLLVLPHQQKIATVLSSEYRLPAALAALQAWRGWSPDQRRQTELVRGRVYRLVAARSMDPERKEAALLSLLEPVIACEPILCRSHVYGELADLMASRGRGRLQRHYLDLAINHALHFERMGFASQLLGVLGEVHWRAGRVDSMRICWDHALDIGRRHRLPGFSARMYEFQANHFRRQGNLALAKRFTDRASEICREFRGRYHEVRYLLNAMNLKADLGLWNLVRQDLDRLAVIERQLQNSPHETLIAAYSHRAQRMRARTLMATGEADAGHNLYARLVARETEQNGRFERTMVRLGWADGLVANGRFESAAPVAEEARRICREGNLSELEPHCWVLLAEVQAAFGEETMARVALDSFRASVKASPSPHRESWLRHDCTILELCRRENGAARMRPMLGTILERWQDFLREMDGSAESFLLLGQVERLRGILQECAGEDAELSYATEMLWRQAVYGPGRRNPSAAALEDCARLLQEGLAEPPPVLREHRRLLIEAGAVHLLFLADAERITRWYVREGEIQKTILATEPATLAAMVTQVLAQMSDAPAAAGFPVRLQRRLQGLSAILLPDDLASARGDSVDKRPLLLITANGSLGSLPFCTLSSRADAYRPLLRDFDLADLRAPLMEGAPPAAGPSLVVADPTPAPELTRWLGPLARLDHGLREARLQHASAPGSIFLQGAAATKRAVLGHAAVAPMIYVASHACRDPQVPYLSFIPLAADPRAVGLEHALLSGADLNDLDLSSCRLVVLSSCASGATYVEGWSSAPGLGVSFADAGAQCVVHTRWDVQDQAAGRLMTAFINTCRDQELHPVCALNAAARATLADSVGMSHPGTWGAYAALLMGW